MIALQLSIQSFGVRQFSSVLNRRVKRCRKVLSSRSQTCLESITRINIPQLDTSSKRNIFVRRCVKCNWKWVIWSNEPLLPHHFFSCGMRVEFSFFNCTFTPRALANSKKWIPCSLNLNQSKSTDYQWNLTDSNS